MTQSTPPHPVLEKYYPSAADRQAFVGALFDGAARHYNHIGQMLDLGSGPVPPPGSSPCGPRPGMRLLDVATGTGLVAQGGVAILGDRRGDRRRSEPGDAAGGRKALAGPLVQGRAENSRSAGTSSTCSAWASPCATWPTSTWRSGSTGVS